MSIATDTTVTVTFDPNSINLQSDVIYPVTLTKAGLMTPDMLAELEALSPSGSGGSGTGIKMYSNLTRPAANAVGAIAGTLAVMIWNTSDNQPNFSDGVNWYDSDGKIT